MSAHERLPSTQSSLTDLELEILRLLTAGHTVKTIAVRLGRSEASINERLRDARRKTGMGSSRELARMLDAQKIWDKNIDLVSPGTFTNDAASPTAPGRKLTKGTIIMLMALPVTAGLALAFITIPNDAAPPVRAETATMAASPLLGRWSLDVSRIPAAERPKSVSMQFRSSTDQTWTGIVEIVGPDGSSQHAEATGKLDGAPVRLTGNMLFADTVSMRQPAANTLVMTFAKGGAPMSTRVYTVQDDGRTMKETIVWAGSEEPRMVTTYYIRAD